MNDEYRNIIYAVSNINLTGPINKIEVLDALNNSNFDKLENIIKVINSDMVYFDDEGDMKPEAIEVLGLVGQALSILSSERKE